jgi:flagellar hook capping protein FlgD
VRRHATTAVVLLLLVGTAVAFAETERLKLKPTPIEESYVQPAFSPACDCDTAKADIRIRLDRVDTVTLRIVDESGEVIRTLIDGKRLPRGRSELQWDGRDHRGNAAPDGRYSVEVQLDKADRTFRLPRTISLDTVPPTIRLVLYTESVQPRQRVRVSYRVSEPAHGVLFVRGNRTVGPTYTKARAAQLQWYPQRPGSYRLYLAAVDLAGNQGPRSPVFVVEVTP